LAEWLLPWDEAADDYAAARLDCVVRPLLASGSPLGKAQQDRLARHDLIRMWQEVLSCRPDLPIRFRDSDAALADFLKHGLDLGQEEFSLSAGILQHTSPRWMAHARRQE
jgi:hypothetical protein